MKRIRKILLSIVALLIIMLVMVAMPAPDTTAQSPALLDEEGNLLDPGLQHTDPGQITPQDLGDVLNSFPNPSGLRGLAFRGGRLWGVTSSGVLHEMDADSGVVLSTVTISPSHNTSGLGFDTLRNVFVVTDAFADVILKVDPTTGTVIDGFSSPDGGPVGAAYDSTRDGYWISDWKSDRVHLVNPDTGVEISSLSIPPSASRIAGTGYDPTNDVIMLHSRDSAETYLIDASDGTQVGVYPTPPTIDVNNGFGAAIRSADLTGYLTHFDVATIFVIDLDLAFAPMVWKIFLPGIAVNWSPPTPTPTPTPPPPPPPPDYPCLFILGQPLPPIEPLPPTYAGCAPTEGISIEKIWKGIGGAVTGIDYIIRDAQNVIVYQASIDIQNVGGRIISYSGTVIRKGKPTFTQVIVNKYNGSGGLTGADATKTYEGGFQFELEITKFCPLPTEQNMTGYRVKVFAPPYDGQEVSVGICLP